MQGRFGGPFRARMYHGSVDVRARRNQRKDGAWPVWKVTRPVGHNVQQRSRHSAIVNNSCDGQIRAVAEMALQRLHVPGPNRRHDRNRARIVGRNTQHRFPRLLTTKCLFCTPRRHYQRLLSRPSLHAGPARPERQPVSPRR